MNGPMSLHASEPSLQDVVKPLQYKTAPQAADLINKVLHMRWECKDRPAPTDVWKTAPPPQAFGMNISLQAQVGSLDMQELSHKICLCVQ